MASATNTTRRALFAIAGAATLLPAVAGAASVSVSVSDLDRQLDDLIARHPAMDPLDHATIDKYYEDQSRVLSQIEALPRSPEFAALRAKAVYVVYCADEGGAMAGMIESLMDQQTTDQRLICQMLESLWGSAARI